MTRIVFCKKFNKELPGLTNQPMPGDIGQDIFENISEQAWKEWQVHQTMLINENRLNLMDSDTRKFLTKEMLGFLSNENYAKPDGFVPPSS